MRSSTGEHFAGLDHVRAVAAFLVVVWHFAHSTTGTPVPFNRAPELGIFDEGHVGVALFMTLSGYLFAKLVNGRRVKWRAFLWNRAIRLLPLLLVVLAAYAVVNRRIDLSYAKLLIGGAVLPQLPNGGWSLTVEAHFYLVLPLLLWAAAKRPLAPLAFVAAMLAIRVAIYLFGADLRAIAYPTIVGRLDQFVFGIFFFMHRARITGPIALAALVAILAFYAWFDRLGGYYNLAPSLRWVWIVLPTVEGLTLGTLIAWYDARPLKGRLMALVQKAGEYSYSIYLLHFFVVFLVADAVDRHIMRLPSLYAALPWAFAFFCFMVAVGHLSYRLIEAPALRLRRPYVATSNRK